MSEPRKPSLSRRRFLSGSGSAAMAAAVGAPIVFGERLPAGVLPVVLSTQDPQPLAGKDGLRLPFEFTAGSSDGGTTLALVAGEVERYL